MKPRIFIGSSKESLSIAYTIQENLEADSYPTVWTQGIFNLSSTALDDLIKALSEFDFAIFVFSPEDILIIRDSKKTTVRDNVLFEMGLFIGRLGKERVYFIQPQLAENTHIASDLLGINYGTYDNTRTDGNLKAALGPFCNQVRNELKEFLVENLLDFVGESVEAKRIAILKPPFWEFLLAAELIETKMKEINRCYGELEKDLIFRKTKNLNESDAIDWSQTASNDIIRILDILKKTMQVELFAAFGPPGQAGNATDIKRTIDVMISVCRSLLNWEYELLSLKTESPELSEIFTLMKGWTFDIMNQVNSLASQFRNVPSQHKALSPGETLKISVEFPEPKNMDRILALYDQLNQKYRLS